MKNTINNNNENDDSDFPNLKKYGYDSEAIFLSIKNNLDKFQLSNLTKSIISKRIFSQLCFEPAFLNLIIYEKSKNESKTAPATSTNNRYNDNIVNSGNSILSNVATINSNPDNSDNSDNPQESHNSDAPNLSAHTFNINPIDIPTEILDNYIYNYISNYIEPSLKNLHNPFLMKDMDKAVSRIAKALVHNEKICVFGDYDVDGITATSFLVLFLREINKYIIKANSDSDNADNNDAVINNINSNNDNDNSNNSINDYNNNRIAINNKKIKNANNNIIYKIPNRIKHGYGLGIEPINELIVDNNSENCKPVSLIITVDLGITNYEPVEYANSNNIDVVICDHHEVPDKIPPASAILNPKQRDDKFPFKFLPGVGIAFNLAMALRKQLFDDGLISSYPNLKDYLDIVCIGIVGDIVPMYDENRLLVYYGLKIINSEPRPGIKELKKICNLRFDNVTESDIAWKIAPKINSSGRVGNPDIAIELLMSQDYEQARTLALKLEELNKKRKKLETECFNSAIIKIEQMDDTNYSNPVIILSDDSWHPGVIGIASSKLAESLMKPVLLLSGYKEGIFIGSARSYENIDIYSILKQFKKFFIKFGGHKLACGLSIKKSEFDKFIDAANKLWEKNWDNLQSGIAYTKTGFKFNYDEELSADNISNELINKLKLMAPYGVLNEQPKFCIKNPLIDNIITRKIKNTYNSVNRTDSGNTNISTANKILKINNNLNFNFKKIINNEYFTCDIINYGDKINKSNKAIIFKNISCFRAEDFDFKNLNNTTVKSIIFEFFNNYIKILDIIC
jgi:single-stranded-DNA-specific exonuclease